MVELSDDQALHLSLVTPWRQAVACYFGEDRDDIDDLRWEMPDDAREGDVVVSIVDSPTPAIIAVDTILDGPPGRLTFDDADGEVFRDGISVAALEQRIGAPLPEPPVTIRDRRQAQRMLTAIRAEVRHPTPWRDREPHVACEASPEHRPRTSGKCACCDRPFSKSVRGEPHCELGDFSTVCPECHDRLHTPIPRTVCDLAFERRPPCPVCSARETWSVMYGMPAVPPGPGVLLAGCVLTGPTLEFRCGECDYEWSDDDNVYPPVESPKNGDTVRARLVPDDPSVDRLHTRLTQPGRVVVGMYHSAFIEGAWGSGVSHTVVTRDGRFNPVAPETIRVPEARGWP
ncbi:hypothetical protein GCM10009624_16160 [Gordonia sinesedis]